MTTSDTVSTHATMFAQGMTESGSAFFLALYSWMVRLASAVKKCVLVLCPRRKEALLQVVALFQFEGSQSVAEIIGIVASAAAMAYYIKRCIDTTGSQSDWPGPKAPVAGMALVAFFALNICLQGLRG